MHGSLRLRSDLKELGEGTNTLGVEPSYLDMVGVPGLHVGHHNVGPLMIQGQVWGYLAMLKDQNLFEELYYTSEIAHLRWLGLIKNQNKNGKTTQNYLSIEL